MYLNTNDKNRLKKRKHEINLEKKIISCFQCLVCHAGRIILNDIIKIKTEPVKSSVFGVGEKILVLFWNDDASRCYLCRIYYVVTNNRSH